MIIDRSTGLNNSVTSPVAPSSSACRASVTVSAALECGGRVFQSAVREADDGVKPRAKRSEPWVNVPSDTSPRMGATEPASEDSTRKPINERGSVTPVGGSDAGVAPNPGLAALRPGLYSATPFWGSFDPVCVHSILSRDLFDRPLLHRLNCHGPGARGGIDRIGGALQSRVKGSVGPPWPTYPWRNLPVLHVGHRGPTLP